MPRPRFTLRTLLIVVAVCAVVALVYSWLPNYVTLAELGQLEAGMNQEEVRVILGEPDHVVRYKKGNELWSYGFLHVVILIDEHGKYIEWQDW